MSVYKPKGAPFYVYDFQWRGRRFCGTTNCPGRRDALAVERDARERVKSTAAQEAKAVGSLRLADVASRYWKEVGQYHAGADNTKRDLARLVGYFPTETLLSAIADDDVAKLVAWRRGHRVERKKGKPGPLVSNTTVNRSTTEVLKKLFTRAKAWGVKLSEPKWRLHRLEEPEERVRELVGDEGSRLELATRDDYRPFFAFAAVSGLRLNECLLRWSEVNWETKRISKLGKGRRLVTTPITPAVRAILWPLRKHNAEFVFTYMAKRTSGLLVKGTRYPLTRSGVKTMWRRLRSRAGVVGFRFHDFRHDVGTKLLRETGNLKLVQRALNHRDLKTTLRYAHVLDSEVADALQTVTKKRRA